MPIQLSDAFERYLLALRNTAAADQTEMTSRAALETLLNEAAGYFAQSGTVVTHEPRRAQDKGAPDFKIASRGMILGYVENKAIGENLAKVAKSDQIKKYLTLSPNILLTDYLHWVWITPNGTQEARLADAGALEGKMVSVRPERAQELQQMLQGFYSQPPQQIGKAKALAEALATRSQLLRDFLGDELVRQNDAKAGGVLMGLYTAFKSQVSHEITLKEFADAFAQTLAYGLFLAKLNARPADTITLLNAKQFVPASFGLIQELVGFLDRLDEARYADIRWVVEEVLSIINNLDLAAIHEDLAFRNRKARRGTDTRSEDEWRLFSRDPFIYFYEDYLAKYDAKMRKSRGVYYTPPPIVNFIVRAINDILKDSFGIADGLADRKRVTVLDFATGTGTFLVEVLERIFEEIGGAASGKAPLVVRDHILKNIYGFEYLIAPYTIAHLKLSQYLRDKEVESGRTAGEFGPHDTERFQVFLTNTLEPINPEPNYLLPELSHETEAAQAVKDKPILVITGNPPYARHSKNMGPAARSSVFVYRENIPELSKPAQGKALQDDYVKFIRFAEKKMDVVDQGIVGIITNHSYLRNPTLRGMRQHLLGSFDQVFIIDFHGNAEEPAGPNGQEDKNVFDIKIGVAITILVKGSKLQRGVWHLDLWGQRQTKYDWSANAAIDCLPWTRIEPESPLFLFAPRLVEKTSGYSNWWNIPAIFAPNGDPAPGFVSTQDQFAISFSGNEARAKVATLLASSDEVDARRHFRLCSTDQWSYQDSVKALVRLDLSASEQRVAFRPFDERFTIWNSNVCVHRRERANRHMLEPNVALLTARRNRSPELDHFFVSDLPAEAKTAESSTQSFIFPLFLYPAKEGEKPPPALKDLYEGTDPFAGRERIENIAPEFRRWLDTRYDASPSPEQLFGYIYAVLHAPTYRTAYADFLRTDFPRVPFPEKFTDFEALAALGWELAETHLMRRKPKVGTSARYVGKGDNKVEKPRWSEAEGTVWINATQGFADVPANVWAFTIGGYQVLDKYIKSRKGRTLTLDEIEHVEKVVAVLGFTIRQMDEIDTAYAAAFPGGVPADAAVDEADDIHSDPGIMGGEPVFRGTRLPVRSVAEMLEAGADETEMLDGYPSLTLGRMDLARRWAEQNPAEPPPPTNIEFKVVAKGTRHRRSDRKRDVRDKARA